MIFALLLYFRNMPTGLDALLHYSSTSETCQLDLMIFCATPLLQEHANWTWWSLRYSSTSGTCQLDLMIFALLLYFRNMPTGLGDLCATPLLQEHANWTWWSLRYSSTSGTCQLDLMIFALLLYFRNMPTGLDALLHYSSTSGTCQLDLMIFALLLYFRNMPTGLDDLVHYSSTSGTCQLDLMIFALLLYLRNMPTERNDLLHYSSTSGTCQLDLMIFGLTKMFVSATRSFLHETFFDHLKSPCLASAESFLSFRASRCCYSRPWSDVASVDGRLLHHAVGRATLRYEKLILMQSDVNQIPSDWFQTSGEPRLGDRSFSFTSISGKSVGLAWSGPTHQIQKNRNR